jgi:hypothetical protein
MRRTAVLGILLLAVGDSVVIHMGPYPSAIRDDVMVSTMTVSESGRASWHHKKPAPGVMMGI